MRCQHLTLRVDPQLTHIDERVLNALIQDLDVFALQTALVPASPPFWSILVFSRERLGSAAPAADPASALVPDVPLTTEQAQLYERLRDWRAARAQADSLPPYIIAHNASLRAIAQRSAVITTLEDLAAIRQFGPRRARKYGAQILPLLAQGEPHDLLAELDEETLF